MLIYLSAVQGGRGFIGFRREQVEMANQQLPDRTADEGACHQAEGGRCKGDGGGIRKSQLFQHRAEGTRGAVAADQGDGTVRQAHEGVLMEYMGKGNADAVLDDDENTHEHRHFDDKDAALFDEFHTGHVADTGEEEHHAPVLHHRILGIGPQAFGVQNAVDDGENRTADNRRRNAVFPEEFDFCFQKTAQKKDSHRGCQCLVHIEIDVHAVSSHFFLPKEKIHIISSIREWHRRIKKQLLALMQMNLKKWAFPYERFRKPCIINDSEDVSFINGIRSMVCLTFWL